MATGVTYNVRSKGQEIATWGALGGAENGASAPVGTSPDRTVQVSGTFGGATVGIYGSNDNATFFLLHDPQGNNLEFTADGMALIAENPTFVRPQATGGTDSAIAVIISGVRNR